MVEREPLHETIGRGELFFLDYPTKEGSFSGYGLTVESGRKDLLVGVLRVDPPKTADPTWLQSIDDTFGVSQFLPLTINRERGLSCNVQLDYDLSGTY